MYISFNISVAEMWLENVVDRPSCSQAMTSSNSIQSSWHSFSSPLVDMFNLKKDLKAGLSTLSKYSKNQFSPSILVGRFLTGPVQSVRVFLSVFRPFPHRMTETFQNLRDFDRERERERWNMSCWNGQCGMNRVCGPCCVANAPSWTDPKFWETR